MKGKLIKHGHSYGLILDNKLVAFAHPEDFTNNGIIGKLSLKNCQAIERNYDLDELADKANGYLYYDSKKEYKALAFDDGYKVGFQKALELLGDKKYSEEDMIDCWETAHQAGRFEGKGIAEENWQTSKDYIQSLQQTEWDVEFNPTEKDENGCLILKRL